MDLELAPGEATRHVAREILAEKVGKLEPLLETSELAALARGEGLLS